MARVMTVLGPVSMRDLGTTMAHEHVLFDLSTYYAAAEDAPAGVEQAVTQDRLWWFRANPMSSKANLVHHDVELAISELGQYAGAAGRTVVDQTVAGIGPRPADLAEVSRRTGVHVVAGTGFYIAGSYPAEVAGWSEDRLADHLRTEMTAGIAGTNVRAGIIGELGVSSPVQPFERRMLAAAARVQDELDCAVGIHTPWDDGGVHQAAAAAEAASLDPSRTALCHLDNRFRDRLDEYRKVARQGFMLSLDCFGRECYYPHLGIQLPSDAERIRAIAGLVDDGLVDQVLMSQDICFAHELATKGGHGYAHILRTVLPRLRRAGLDDDSVRRILVVNPRRWLSGEPQP